MLVEVKKFGKEEKVAVTSLDIAETFGKEHKHILEDIRKIEETISTAEFTALFQKISYKATNGKTNPMYAMARDGFTLLVMGYTGEKAMKYKLDYIKQFNAMENELNGKRVERAKGIAIRQALTDTIARVKENERMHGHAYSNYTNLIYKLLFNKTAKQILDENGITDKKAVARDYLTLDELQAVQDKEMLVNGLLASGWGYEQIKEFLTNGINTKLISA